MNYRILESLFDEYTRSLQVIRPGAVDTFICPLCMCSFTKEDVSKRNLSLEHVPPKSIKTVIETMTCTKCNKTIGSELQSFMVNDVRRKELEVGIVLNPIRTKVQLPGIAFDTEIISSEAGRWKTTSPVSILPPSLRSLESSRKFIGTVARISLNKIGPKETIDRAYLHSSYLTLFSLLGYPYILQPFMAAIRQHINEDQIFSSGSRVVFPTSLKYKLPFFDPREKRIEISIIGTAADPEKSCFALHIAGELVLMPFINDYCQVIHSEFNSLLSDLAKGKGTRRKSPFLIGLLDIDPLCKFSTRYLFEKGKHMNNLDYLKLSPSK